MFFRVLKLFGLDIPARVAKVRTTLEERVELAMAKEQVADRAQAAAAMAAPFGLAGGSTGDLPLTLILSKMIRLPAVGHPLLDDLLVRLCDPVRGVADETVEGVAHAVRYGARPQLVMALGSEVLIGWFLGRPHEVEAA